MPDSTPAPAERVKHITLTFPVPEGASKEEIDGLFLAAVAKTAHKRGMNLEMTVDPGGTSDRAAAPPRRPLPPVPGQEHVRPPGIPPDPSLCASAADFNDRLRQLHVWAGSPAYREVARRAADLGSTLSKSSIGRILAPEAARLPSTDHLVALVLAYGVTERECRDWVDTLERVKARANAAGEPEDQADAVGGGRSRPAVSPELVLTGTAAVIALPNLIAAAPFVLPAVGLIKDGPRPTGHADKADGHPGIEDTAPRGTGPEDTEEDKRVLTGTVFTRAEVEAAADRLVADYDARMPASRAPRERAKWRHELLEILRGARDELRAELDKTPSTPAERFRQEVTIAVTSDGFRLTARGVRGVATIVNALVISRELRDPDSV